ncbi:MAG: histidine kinase [Bacteroidia bacterium]|nr:histidine kinase [Bacteroidia bacterium]
MQAQEPVFKHFTAKDGLPSNEAHFVLSDSKGYVWICTDAGIAKYNANTFKLFNTSNGMPDNTIFEVKEDKSGKIWFRTFTSKIGYILNDSVYNIEANSVINSFVGDGRVISFAIESNGNLFIGKQNSEPCSFLKITPPYKTSNVKVIKSTYANKCGIDVLMLNENSLVYTEARNGAYGLVYHINILNKDLGVILRDSILHTDTWAVAHFCIGNNALFYNTKDILIKFDLKNKTTQIKKEGFRMLAIGSYKDSILLVGGYSKGIYCYNNNLQQIAGSFLNGISPTCITKDFQNGLWISTLESGLYYYGNDDVVKYKMPGEDASSIISLVCTDQNSLLVGLVNSSIYELNYTIDKRIISAKLFEDKKSGVKKMEGVNILIPTNGRSFFIGAATGNFFYKKDKVHHFEKLEQSLRVGSKINDKLILCAVNDVFEVDTAFETLKHIGKINDRVSGVTSCNKEIFVCGLKGLYKYNSGKNNFEHDHRFTQRIEAVAENNGKLYLATKFNGVLVVKGNKIDTISEKRGLISNICKSIYANGNELWVASNRGISKITDHNNGNYDILNYSLDYFVDPVEISKLCMLGNYLLFHSADCIYSFNTNAIPAIERCSIVKVFANDLRKDIDSEIILDYNTPDLKINYEALFYNLKGKIVYRYNYGRGWVYTYETNVNLAALSPGNYTFRVEALNVNNKWVPSSNTLSIIVKKPYWASPLFIILCIVIGTVIISSILFAINRRHLKQERKRNELNIRLIELESKAVRSLMNPHFIFNSLNTLQRFILESDLQNAESYLTKFAKLLRKLIESSAIDKISLEDEINILTGYLEIEKLRFKNAFDFKIVSDIGDELNIPFMLIQPFVENAVWHGLIPKKEKGELNISFKRKDEHSLICVVEDNGVGREAGALRKDPLKGRSLALELIKQRLELMTKSNEHDFYYIVTDKKDNELKSLGTKVEIIIPILK